MQKENDVPQKVLTPEEKSAIGVAKAQAKIYASMLRRSGLALDDEEQCLLEPVFAALDSATTVGSVCVTSERFDDACELLDMDVSLEAAADILLDRKIAVQNAFPEETPVCPLIVDRGEKLRLYDERNFYDELHLAEKIGKLAAHSVEVEAVEDPQTENIRAVKLATQNRLTIVSGGPGTGKTTAVMRILKALLDENPNLRIALAAPTGKAAGRMQQAVVSQAQHLPDGPVKKYLSDLTAQTIHRLLLTPMPDGNRPSATTPLDCDVLVIDESSMIEIGLAVRLFDAIDETRTRVILLGDRHQLAAVGPGAVFGDLSDKSGALSKVISHLTISHRFATDKAVGQLSQAINTGDVQKVIEELKGSSDSVADDNIITWQKGSKTLDRGLTRGLRKWLDSEIKEILQTIRDQTKGESLFGRLETAETITRQMQRFGVLCAQRRGAMSVSAVNRYVDEVLTEKGISGQHWRQVIVRQNDDLLGVHNGDVGVVVPGVDGEADDVYFPAENGQGRFIKLGLLPQYELAFAITIHQSQGSEYERVAVVLPTASDSGLATRELLYTAVTRVKDSWKDGKKFFGTLDIFGDESVLKQAVKTPVMREGALPERLSLAIEK